MISNIDKKEYRQFEWQANEFAGRLLVPYDDLIRETEKIYKELGEGEVLYYLKNDPSSILGKLSQALSKIFGVSEEVIEKRLEREELFHIASWKEKAVDEYMAKSIIKSDNQELVNTLKSLIPGYKKLTILTAYFSLEGLNLIADDLKKSGIQTEIIIGSVFENQNLTISDLPCVKIFLCRNKEKFVHGKFYLFENNDDYRIVIGSSNFTRSGLQDNFELNLLTSLDEENKKIIDDYIKNLKSCSGEIRNSDKDYIPFHENLESRSSVITQEFIETIEYNFRKNEDFIKESIDKVLQRVWTGDDFKEKYLLTEDIFAGHAQRGTIRDTDSHIILKIVLLSIYGGIIKNRELKGSEEETSIKDYLINDLKYPESKLREMENHSQYEDLFILQKEEHKQLGKAFISEILNKYFIRDYPIFNSRSRKGLYISGKLEESELNLKNKLPYDKFVQSCDELYVSFKQWASEKKLHLRDEYKYCYMDALLDMIVKSGGKT
jgi:HKD family nuclease